MVRLQMQFLFVVFILFQSLYANQDSLTAPVCNNNPNQIIAKLDGNKIEYVMGEYHLNISTIKGYLYNDGASKPYLKKYSNLRGTSYAMFAGGVALIATGFATGKSYLTLGGGAALGGGLYFYFKSNGKFRVAIHEYNKSVCTNRHRP